MPTIKDIATLAGVSHTTVSHVIHKTRPVSTKIRGDVEAAIKRLNYVPAPVTRPSHRQATSTIGLLVSNSSNPYFAELAAGIEETCYRAGYCVVLCNSDDQPERQHTYLQALLEKQIDGLIVCSTGDDVGLANDLRATKVPVIVVDRQVKGVSCDLVQVDHYKGGYLATRHLLELKHKSIACVAGPETTAVSIDRLNGYRKALAEASAPFQSEWVVRGDFTAEGGYKAARILLKRARITAVFASNDLMGIGLLRFAEEHGIRVPQQLSVIGFDGIDLGRYIYPALTTVGQSIRHQGETAAATLLERIRRGPEVKFRKIIINPELTIRESTTEPAQFILSRYE
ncbi:MAG TPA: LacI family DNA-binding transcriptional regulator [Chthoniobacterales bacterium]|jgi:LacI family transcriptional regulator|nr:LacI family DNA-binding transcriptional regulator [Chthoniobacterales bacterium]